MEGCSAFQRAWNRGSEDQRRRPVAVEGIVVHCRDGVGRTGVVAARLLVEFGEEPEGAPCADRLGRESASRGARAGSDGSAKA